MKLVLCLSLSLAFPTELWAHHSRQEYEGRDVTELEGELMQVMWFNPHAGLMLKVRNEVGAEHLLKIETFGSPRTFTRFGITGDLFRVGERVSIAGRASKLRPNYFLATNALLADGTEIVLGESGRHWSGAPVVGLGYAAAYAVDESKLKAAAAENKGFFRVWSVPARGATRHEPFTPEAVAARELWDVADNPITRCEPPGMPVTMMVPNAFQFLNEGATINLHSVYFDTIRTIHVADAGNPEAQPATRLGYSVGRWEGRTLVVETTRINYPYFDYRGTPQSPSVRIMERFTLSEDQSRLDYQLTVTDPLTFTEPATYAKYLLALDEPFAALDCNVF
jgi:hypothetical protein